MYESSQESVRRFDTEASAAKYAAALPGSATDSREQRCLRLLLKNLPRQSTVLDLPTGTGRLLPLLCQLGYVVTAADSSSHMIKLAREYADSRSLSISEGHFVVTDIMKTPFADGAFDAVVCNRLFHHFSEPQTRQAALMELRRICKGPIIVSFFRSPTWGSLTFRIKHLFRDGKPTDRIPIRLSTFRNDIHQAGLTILRVLPTRRLISKNCYLMLGRR